LLTWIGDIELHGRGGMRDQCDQRNRGSQHGPHLDFVCLADEVFVQGDRVEGAQKDLIKAKSKE
jgi:hypothetical protein